MKKILIYLLLSVLLIGCKSAENELAEDRKIHNELVKAANVRDEQLFENDTVGLGITLSEEFEFLDYEELNLSSDFSDVTNILLYATLGNSELLIITETLYVRGLINESIAGVKEDLERQTADIDYIISEVMIDGENSTSIGVTEDMGEDRISTYNYYYVHHKDSMITIMIAYDHEVHNELPEDIISWIRFN